MCRARRPTEVEEHDRERGVVIEEHGEQVAVAATDVDDGPERPEVVRVCDGRSLVRVDERIALSNPAP